MWRKGRCEKQSEGGGWWMVVKERESDRIKGTKRAQAGGESGKMRSEEKSHNRRSFCDKCQDMCGCGGE